MDNGVFEVTENLSDRIFNEDRMAAHIREYSENEGWFQQTRIALDFAIEKHQGQYRRGRNQNEKVPYVYHPLLLTCHAMALGFEDDDIYAACLLHDVCEDCGVLPEELPVGDECQASLKLLTKPEGFDKSRKAQEAYYHAIAGDRTATIVKLIDRCNNVSTMANAFSNEKMAAYILETQDYIYPLMEKARELYPEYTNQLFLIRYHMKSVIEALRHHMKAEMER